MKRKATEDAKTTTTAKKAKTTKAYLTGPYKRTVRKYRPEVKIRDHVGGVTSTTTTPGRITICDIDEGTGFGERVGDWISATGLEFKATLAHNPLATSPASFVRLMVVQDLEQSNNVLSSMSEVIQGDYLSAYNHRTSGRFKVYMDKLINLDNVSNQSVICKSDLKFDFGIQFDGDVGTNLTKNGFYFFYIGSDGSNGPIMDWNLRFKFIDS